MIESVLEFHTKFGLPTGDTDVLTDNRDAAAFRRDFMQEELDEFMSAWHEGDRVKMFDALLDLAYVVHGTALFMGVDPDQWNAGMDAVHSRNMAKVRVARAGESKRGSAFDVRKPDGWTGPERMLAEVLSWKK